jgi:hypothetical protein
MMGAELDEDPGIFLLQNPGAAVGRRHHAEKFEWAIRRLGQTDRTNVFQNLREAKEDGRIDFF